MIEKKINNKYLHEVMLANLLASSHSPEKGARLSALTSGGSFFLTYLLYRKSRSKTPAQQFFFTSLDAMSGKLNSYLQKSCDGEVAIKRLSPNTLSLSLKSLQSWGIVEYIIHTEAKSTEKHGERKGIRVVLCKDALANVKARLKCAAENVS